jgi:hypothetical protein
MIQYFACLCLLFQIIASGLIAILVSNVATQRPVPSQNYALLVAVTNYNHHLLNTLKYPEEDAKAIKNALEKGGYEVDVLLGPEATSKSIVAKLDGMARKGNSSGAVLLGFFGHGVEYDGTNEALFCPYDTLMRIATDADGNELKETEEKGGGPLLEPNPESLISMQKILNALKTCPAGNKVLLADCCRSSPNTARGRAFGSSFRYQDLPDNTAALFACDQGQMAHEHDDWQHGALTLAFLTYLPELAEGRNDINGITGRMSKSISNMVREVTQGKKDQRMKSLVNGIVDLKLRASATEEITNTIAMVLIPVQTSLSKFGYSYYTAKHEVTQKQYQIVMGTNPSHFKTAPAVLGSSDHPVEQVSWNNAMDFCKRLTDLEEVTGSLPVGHVYRLPLKKEWETVAIASETAIRPSTLLTQGWFKNHEEQAGTRKIGLKQANPLGVFDLFGNVAEMCLDSEPHDRTGEPLHAVLGGSWFDSVDKRIAEPVFWTSADSFYNYQGFRVVLAPVGTDSENSADKK